MRSGVWPGLAILLLATASPGSGIRDDVEDQLDVLIEKTNALDSFRARFAMVLREEDEEPMEQVVDLAYQAPDQGYLGTSGNGMVFRMWQTGPRVTLHRPTLPAEQQWATAELPERTAASLLYEELFPSEVKELDPGPRFVVRPKQDPDGQDSISVSVSFSLGRRSHVLDWLAWMKSESIDVSIEGDQLVLDQEGLRLALSRTTGFPESIEMKSEMGRVSLILEELELDQDVDEWVELPEEATTAKEDEDLARSLRDLESPWRLRYKFLDVEQRLERGDLEWDEGTRDRWAQFLTVLHRDLILESLGTWKEQNESWIDSIALYVRTILEDELGDREVLGEEVAESRRELEQVLDQTLDSYLGRLPELGSEGVVPRPELFETEEEVIGQVFDEVLRKPLLLSFEEVEALLDL